MMQTLEQLSAAATWLRQCHDWMMTNDLDMQCPMETSPEDIAISLESIIEGMTSPDDKVEVLYAYCCAEAGGRVAYCDCVKKAHGAVFLPEKQVGDHIRTGQLVAVADDAIECYRHVKRGTVYEVLGEAELQTNADNLVDGSQMMVYRGEDGKLWCRHYDEFHDGRFAAMKDTQP